ncbi:hypothetical protein L9W73_16875, partial [Vibrio aestuarianus]
MINNSSSSVGTCSVSSASLSKGERRISDVQNIDKTIASIRHTDRSGELIFLALRRHKKMKKLQKLSVTLDKYNKTNNKDKRARIDKLKNNINIEIRNYANLGFLKPPTQTRVTSTQTRAASTQTRAASSPPKGYDTAGFPKQRPTKTRVASPPPETASGNTPARGANQIRRELIALESELATLKDNAKASGQGHRDYQAKAPLLKIQIKELKNKLTIAPSTPAASTATVVKPISNALARQENQIRRELIALESELATLKDNAKASG